MKTLKTLRLALMLALVVTALPLGAFADDARSKPLLEEALHLYSERQYVRALDLFKQVQRIEPDNKTADEYIKSCEQRILEWETQGGERPRSQDATWDSLLKRRGTTDFANNASDIIAARRSLVERMRNRSVNTDNIVKIDEDKHGLNITLYHDQLFLPGLQTLRDEALPILENISHLIRDKGDREVTIVSMAHSDSNDPYLLFPEAPPVESDSSLPQTKGMGSSMLFQDIEATRSMILFTYLAQRSMGRDWSAAQ
jgi:flagellar motor protein MotB